MPVSIRRRKQEGLVFDTDEHPRGSTLEKLAALPTPFRDNGSVTAAYQLQRFDGRYALSTMCVGVGLGIATLIERV